MSVGDFHSVHLRSMSWKFNSDLCIFNKLRRHDLMYGAILEPYRDKVNHDYEDD